MTFSLLCKNKVVEKTPGLLKRDHLRDILRSRDPLTFGVGPEYSKESFRDDTFEMNKKINNCKS